MPGDEKSEVGKEKPEGNEIIVSNYIRALRWGKV